MKNSIPRYACNEKLRNASETDLPWVTLHYAFFPRAICHNVLDRTSRCKRHSFALASFHVIFLADLVQNALEVHAQATETSKIATINVAKVVWRTGHIRRQFIFARDAVGEVHDLQLDIIMTVHFLRSTTI